MDFQQLVALGYERCDLNAALFIGRCFNFNGAGFFGAYHADMFHWTTL